VIKAVTVYQTCCDRCGVLHVDEEEGWAPTPELAISAANHDWWERVGDLDLCDKCGYVPLVDVCISCGGRRVWGDPDSMLVFGNCLKCWAKAMSLPRGKCRAWDARGETGADCRELPGHPGRHTSLDGVRWGGGL
jgi:hypothetical protein